MIGFVDVDGSAFVLVTCPTETHPDRQAAVWRRSPGQEAHQVATGSQHRLEEMLTNWAATADVEGMDRATWHRFEAEVPQAA